MAAVANNPKFAKKVGVSKSIGEEFMKKPANKRVKKYQTGGDLRLSPEAAMPDIREIDFGAPIPRPGGGGAVGSVQDIMKSGTTAMKQLSEASSAIGGGRRGGISSPPDIVPFTFAGTPSIIQYKKGGKVKKAASKPKTKAKKVSTSKVRGAGKATKGVRPAKMVKMKGA
jgi:hypothetical protein